MKDRRNRFALIVMIAGALGCGSKKTTPPAEPAQPEAPATSGAPTPTPTPAVSTVKPPEQVQNTIIKWAEIALDACVKLDDKEGTKPASGGTAFVLHAQTQLAVYDTMIALGEGKFEPFSYKKPGPQGADRDAAVATAAYRVMRTRIPGRAAFLDAKYKAAIDAIPESPGKAKGVELGEAVAKHYIDLRAKDHLFDANKWNQPKKGVGVWEPTAPTPPVDYLMVFVTPFSFPAAKAKSFLPPAPPPLTSPQLQKELAETREVGGADSKQRTPEQTQLALWSGEHPYIWSTRNLIGLAKAKSLDPMNAARFFAMTLTACADTLHVGFVAKYKYNTWRPVHAITRAAKNPDPNWKPLLNVNHPEYPAGHGFLGGGALVASLKAFFGTDAVDWTVETKNVEGLTQPSRTFKSLDAFGKDIMDARVYAGLHFRTALVAGQKIGESVTAAMVAKHFRPKK